MNSFKLELTEMKPISKIAYRTYSKSPLISNKHSEYAVSPLKIKDSCLINESDPKMNSKTYSSEKTIMRK